MRTRHIAIVTAAIAAVTASVGTSTALFISNAANPESRLDAGSLTPVSAVSSTMAGSACAAGSITISWTPGGGLADRSLVERRVDGGAWQEAATTTASSWTDPGSYPDGTALAYRVRASLSGTGRWDTAPVQAPGLRCGFAVTGLAASNPCSQVDLTWTAPAGATGHEVEVSTDGGTTWRRAAGDHASASFVDATERTVGANLTYRVRPRAADGTLGPWSSATLANWQDFRVLSVQFVGGNGGGVGQVRSTDSAIFTLSKPAATTTPANSSAASMTATTDGVSFPNVGTISGAALFSTAGTTAGTYVWDTTTQLTWKPSANNSGVTQARQLAATDTWAVSPGVTCAAVAGAPLRAGTPSLSGTF